ncbi:MAG: hypothetical protein ACRCZI_11435 [Cetobacterium sp.]
MIHTETRTVCLSCGDRFMVRYGEEMIRGPLCPACEQDKIDGEMEAWVEREEDLLNLHEMED